jgi:asparagine synthase (glutamine-hydrolysing)
VSAIVGLVRREGVENDLAGVRRMIDALRHRPHDSSAVRQVGPATFGHQLLAATPEAAEEALPVAGNACLLTADLRLDNRSELARSLGVSGHLGDGALVMCAYERWGATCAQHLLGDFSLAIWDPRLRLLFCARDHLGMKPFFYFSDGHILAFASEIKALLSLAEAPRAINLSMVRDHLLGLPGEAAATFYEGIFRLPPASTLTLGQSGPPVIQEYWRLDPTRELPSATEDDLVDEFRSLFREAVSCRLRSTTPVGATLSGGFDSSAVVCTAHTVLGGAASVHAFSLRFPQVPECDEGAYIECIREAGGVVGHDVPGDAGSPLEDILPVLALFDEPCLVQNLHLSTAVYRTAAAGGTRVVLDGHDGDTAISRAPIGRGASTGRRRSLAHSLASLVLHPRRAWSRLHARLGPPRSTRGASGVLCEEFARQTGARERLDTFRQAADAAAAAGDRQLHLRRLTNGYPVYASETMAGLGAVFGIEPRHPFYDRRLLELCLALPPSLKNRDGFTRYIARLALAGMLPDLVRWRPGKTNLSPQFHRGFTTRDWGLVETTLRDNRVLLAPFLDRIRTEESCRRYQNGLEPEASSVIWSAVTLALWLRQTCLSG